MKNTAPRACADVPPSELDLVLSCSHTKRCLLKAGVTTVAQLMALSADDLLRIRGIGQVIARDVLQARERFRFPEQPGPNSAEAGTPDC